MIKEFTYESSRGLARRKLLVIKQDDKYIEGLDLTLLSPEDAKIVEEMYKDFVPVDRGTKINLENYNPAWNKAYRNFVKSRIPEES